MTVPTFLSQRRRHRAATPTRAPASTSPRATTSCSASRASRRGHRGRRCCRRRAVRRAVQARGSISEPVLASSTDGVGTKLRIAHADGALRHRRAGSREPLRERHPDARARTRCSSSTTSARRDLSDDTQARSRSTGMAQACEAHGCALIGGETADMPDIYAPGDFDLVGFIVGVVEREHVIDGSKIARATCCSRCRRAGCTRTATRSCARSSASAPAAMPRRTARSLDSELSGARGHARRCAARRPPLVLRRPEAGADAPARHRAHHRRRADRQHAAHPARRPRGALRARRVARAGAVLADPGAGRRSATTTCSTRSTWASASCSPSRPDEAESIGAQLRDAKPVGRIIKQTDDGASSSSERLT